MTESPSSPGARLRSRSGLILLAFLAIIGFLLVAEPAARRLFRLGAA